MDGFAGFISSVRGDPAEGVTLEHVLGRALRDGRPDEPADEDERQAGLLARGYSAGHLSALVTRLTETQAELAGERDKIEKSQKRQEQIRRAHDHGQVTVFDIMRMDFSDEGDPGKVRRLEDRAASLQRQLADAQAMIAPPGQRRPDPFEEAGRRAHAAFREATRAKLDAVAGAPRQRAARPFGYASRGDAEPDCPGCREAGASASESFLIHHDPWPLDPDAPPAAPDNEAAEQAARVRGRRAQPVICR